MAQGDSDSPGETHNIHQPEHPPCRTLIIDWFGTITIPMLDVALMLANAIGEGVEGGAEYALRALAAYADDSDDNPFHRAERGEIGIDSLGEVLDDIYDGASVVLGQESPCILDAPDRPEVLELLSDLSNAGIMVVVATNNWAENQESLARRYLDTGLAVALVNSALIGARKPERAFFEACLEVCDTGEDGDLGRVVFADDQEANLAAAAEFGFRTVQVTADAQPAIDEIRSLTLG